MVIVGHVLASRVMGNSVILNFAIESITAIVSDILLEFWSSF
jgi:hypothetical protein